MLRQIHLHGKLKNHFGATHELDVETAAEAIRALCSNFGQFRAMLSEGSYQVIRGDLKTGMDLDLEDVKTFRLGKAPLHIVPVIAGAKSSQMGGTAKIILGVALLGAAIFLGPIAGAGLAAPIGGGIGAMTGLTYGNLAVMGGVLALAGVSALLANPEDTKGKKKTESSILGIPGTNYAQGQPVPLVYGEVVVPGVPISGGVDIELVRKKDTSSAKTVPPSGEVDTYDPPGTGNQPISPSMVQVKTPEAIPGTATETPLGPYTGAEDAEGSEGGNTYDRS